MVLDHINLFVSDLEKSRNFYAALLPGEGLHINREFEGIAVGFGSSDYAVLALVKTENQIQPTHLAFRVESHQDVRRLYGLAIQAGGEDYGPPGPRPHYHEHYYAAFILDPDKHILEFVCHNRRVA